VCVCVCDAEVVRCVAYEDTYAVLPLLYIVYEALSYCDAEVVSVVSRGCELKCC
jgi:hypothetical protein